jgi:amino acid adenylation domain-containing protein
MTADRNASCPPGSYCGASGISARKRLAELGSARLARADVFPLSAAQQRLWLADQAVPEPPAYHLTRVVDIDGPLDLDALNAALAEIVSRHEALRTSVLAVGGQPLQRVAPAAWPGLPVIDTTEAAAGELAAAAAHRPLNAAGRPLWRCELHRIGPRRHRLVLVWHHVIADGATVALLLRELAAAYRAHRDGRPSGLPPAAAYRGYVWWERSVADDPGRRQHLEHWRGELAGCQPLGLPGDQPHPAPGPQAPTGSRAATGPLARAGRRPAARVAVRIPAQTADALRAVARANDASLAQLILAGYAVLLHRFSGRDDFAVGLPVSLRRDHRWAHSAGLFVATVPIRIRIAGNPRFTGLLGQVRTAVLAALAAADVPFERAAGATGPFYDVSFGLVQDNVLTLDLPGLTTRVGRVYCERAKFDLHLELADPGPGGDLDGVLEYDAGRFGAPVARQLADALATLFRGAAATPGQRIGRLPLWSAPAAPPVPPAPRGAQDGARIDRLFAEMARARPDDIALIDAGDGQSLSYAGLAARAADVAGLLATHGVRRGDFVGVALTRSADMVVAILGVLTAGAAYVPLDPGYPAGQLDEMITRSAVKLVIGGTQSGTAQSEMAQSLMAQSLMALPGQRVPVIELPEGAGPAGATNGPARVVGDGGDPAYVMFTSGSTGRPKAVVIPHRAVLRLVRGAGFATMTGAQRWLHAAAPAFDGATLELWAPLLNGGTLVVLPGLPDVPRLGAVIRRYQVTSAFLSTGLFNLVVDTDVEALRPLGELVIGGEAASADHVRRALRVVGTVVNGYGPTENTTFTTCHPLHAPAEVTAPVPLGRPVNGTSVIVMDRYGHPVPAGATGEILAGGHGLALGYAGAPGLTAERFVPSPAGPPGARLYRTGDYGWVDADGVVHFAGRRDDQVKVRGFRIELGAIEQAVLAHPGVAQVSVVAHADPSGDRRLVGYVVGNAGGPALSRYLADTLPAHMIPGQWISLPELPLGPTGKVDRHALPDPGVGRNGLPAPRSARDQVSRPLTATEELFATWYTELLGLADVSPDTDFFAVGGHSLLALRLAARINDVLALDVPAAIVFDHPRLADLAAAVGALERAGA